MKKLQSLHALLVRPRYLRAIPSLLVLTTAMAWGVAPDSDSADTLQKKTSITLSQSHTAAGVGPQGTPRD